MAEYPASEAVSPTVAGGRLPLAAVLQLPRRVVLLVLAWVLSRVIIGGLVAGLAGAQPGGAAAVNWAVSRVQNPMLVAEIVAERLPNTLLLVGAAMGLALALALILALVAVLVHRLEDRAGPLGSVLKGLGRIVCFAPAALPAWGLGVVLVYFLAFRWQLLPAVGMATVGEAPNAADTLRHLGLPALALAALPAVATAQAAARELTLPRAPGGARRGPAGLLRALGTLLGQSGGVVGAAVLVETAFAWPGLGRAVAEGLLRKDYPVLLGALTALTLFILVGRLAAELFRWLERLVRKEPEPAAPAPWRLRARKVYVVAALGLLLVPFGLAAAGVFSSPEAVLRTDTAVRSQEPSPEHPWGTDAQGRDIQARVLRGTLLSLSAAVIGAIGAVLVGGGYGVLAGYLSSQRTLLGESLSDVLLWPADVALYLPALPAALLVARRLPAADAPTEVNWLPVLGAVALALLPRTIRAAQTLWLGRAPGQTGALLDGLGALFAGAVLFGLGIGATVDYVGVGMQPPTPALGSLLRDGMNALQTNVVALWAPLLALWACALALYLAADALIGYFQEKTVLARLNE